MAEPAVASQPSSGKLGATERQDAWWATPLATAIALGAFIIYATWRAFENNFYHYAPYHSPFYSPLIPVQWISPALLVLWIPAGFRLTCYYARKAYYRAYFLDPPACAVGESRSCYRGETSFPFVLQNLHRYFLLLALVALLFQWIHLIQAFNFNGRFGMGTGTVILLIDVLFLTGYVFSCHSLRHMIGGGLDKFSGSCVARTRLKLWTAVSTLNCHHMKWFWLSLFSVGIADLYIRLVAAGVLNDFRIF